MKDFESLTEISVESYCKVNPAWFLVQMTDSWKHSLEM